MNVCFLDFDGVFTLTRACYLLGDYVDHAAVKILNKFLVDNEFKIVVSSTWRKGSTALELSSYLNLSACFNRGFSVRDYHRALSVASSTKLIDDDTCNPLVRPFKPRGVGRGINTYYENYIKNKGKDIE